MGYIRFPIESDPETLVQDVYDYIVAQSPDWKPTDGNLDVWIIRALAFKAAEMRDLATDVQDDIFRYFGAVLLGIPPIDAQPAFGYTTWTMADTLGHTIPAGTQVSMSDTAGNVYPFLTVNSVTIAAGSSATTAGAVIIQALTAGVDANSLGGQVRLIDVLDYVQSVAIVGTTGGGVDAEADGDYLNRLVRRLQRLSTRPILPQDFADAALDASTEVDRAVAIDGYNPFHNLLTANAASVETDISDWASQGATATLAQTAAVAADGTKAIQMTIATNGGPGLWFNVSNKVAVNGGDTITMLAYVRSAAVPRQFSFGPIWYDSTNTLLGVSGTLIVNGSFPSTTTGWTAIYSTYIAPINAAWVRPRLDAGASLVGEVHYADKFSIRRGAGTDWVPGGTPETGNDRMVSVAAVKSDGTPVSAGAKSTIDATLQAQRELNFIVNIIDPKYTTIDVHADIKVATGYTSTQVVADVNAAITSYLSSARWGKPENNVWVESPCVYYNELVALVSNVLGVDRVVDLTSNITGAAVGRVNINILTPAGLTTPGSITTTAV